MRPGRLISITLLGARRDPRGFLLSAAGVAAGVAAFVFFVGLGQGVSTVVREKIFPVDTSHVKVVPQRVSLGSFLGGGVLDEDAVDRLSSLPGVERAYRQIELGVPAVSRYSGDFFGRNVRMGVDILALGVEPDYVRADLPPGTSFADPGDADWAGDPDGRVQAVVPAVISRRLLEIYNSTFAPARGLPRLGERQVIGFTFPVTLGTSFISRPGAMQRRTVTLKVVGVSDRGLLLGVTLPLDTVRRWNDLMLGEEAAEPGGYSSLVLAASGPEQVQEIVAAVRTAGFDVDQTEQKLAEEIGAAITVTTLTLSLLSLLVLALAAVSIARAAHAGVAARTREIGVMRAVGASRREVGSIFLAESAAAGLTGGIGGASLGMAAAVGTDLVAASFVPDFPFKPDSFFLFPVWLPALAVACALASALLGALLPAIKASRLDPVAALSGGP